MEFAPNPLPDPGRRTLAVGVAGFGAIGRDVALGIVRGALPGVSLTGVSARDRQKTASEAARLSTDIRVMSLDGLVEASDIIVECASAAAVREIVQPAVIAGKKTVVLSIGALMANMDLLDLARKHGGQIIVPTGALLGLDAVGAAQESKIHSALLISRKPVKALIGVPYLADMKLDIRGIVEPLRIFQGTAREGARAFPANANVAAALSFAGIGPDRTMMELWADPALTRNVHRVTIDSDAAHIDMSIENIPSDNPKTSRITALSVLRVLRKLSGDLWVGS